MKLSRKRSDAASVCCLMIAIACSVQSLHAAAEQSQVQSSVAPGFQLGQRPINYDEMGRCLEAMAAKSERVRLATYGTTPLGRQLRVVTLSAPTNLARLDEIKATLARLAQDDGGGVEAEALAASIPAVVWMGYGIHSDELSAPDAGLRLIERLATGQDAQTRSILEKLVVYVDPMANPDGRERYLARVDAFRRRTPVVDPQDIIQTPPWPPGRLNHYLMDLNRDALFITQPESEARVTAILRAHPQLFVDAHEMVYQSTLLLGIPGEPLNPYLPAAVLGSWGRLGADVMRSYDSVGKSYYTRSWDETFYPGYYDILPAYSGVTPILFEQARSSGVSVELPNGRTRTFADAVDNHLFSAWATLASAADHRAELMNGWRSARRTAGHETRSSEPKAWFVLPDDDYKLARLIRILDVHQVLYYRLTVATTMSGLRSPWSDMPQSRLLPAGTLMVPTSQAVGALVRNLFNFHVPMDEKFLAAERERIDLGRKSQVYDITAWSLPLAFDLNAYWSTSIPGGSWRPRQDTSPAVPDAELVTSQPRDDAPTLVKPARYGYIYRDPSLFVTARLLNTGIRIRVATESFEQQGQSFPPGTFLIRNDDQASDRHGALTEAASKFNTLFYSTNSARAQLGPDLGDDKFALLDTPRIAVIGGAWTQAMNVGALWQMFDDSIGIPVTLLDVDRLESADLSRYNVLLLPDAEDSDKLGAALAGSSEGIKSWIRGGGTLVAQAGGVLAAAEAGLTSVVPRAAAADPSVDVMLAGTTPVISEAAQAILERRAHAYVFPTVLPSATQWLEARPGSDRSLRTLPIAVRRYLPHGAYLHVDLRPRHWLRYGANDRVPVLFREQDALLARAPDVIGRYGEPRELALAGLVWPEAIGYIATSAYLTREKVGRGQVIAFANDAVYRGYSLGTQRLLLNAAILGPGMRSE